MRPLILGLALGLITLWGFATAGPRPLLQITLASEVPYYHPTSAQVSAGTTIRWWNPTPIHHTITQDDCDAGGPCMFDSEPIPQNTSYTVASLPPGRYPYHCRLHPVMRGVVIVSPSKLPEQT